IYDGEVGFYQILEENDGNYLGLFQFKSYLHDTGVQCEDAERLANGVCPDDPGALTIENAIYTWDKKAEKWSLHGYNNPDTAVGGSYGIRMPVDEHAAFSIGWGGGNPDPKNPTPVTKGFAVYPHIVTKNYDTGEEYYLVRPDVRLEGAEATLAVGVNWNDQRSSYAISAPEGGICSQDGNIHSCSSDERLKENIRPIENAVEYLSEFEPVEFTWKDSKEASLGLIAQDVEETHPELVVENAKGYKSYNDPGFKYMLIQAVKELKQENEELRARIEKLEN
ncbi:hypothetical protein GF327_08145, partial [Candidatus Woesearchaeota archaeon]|nr:hypothetical protein [Candidatus Woesearchaeota archaeon]